MMTMMNMVAMAIMVAMTMVVMVVAAVIVAGDRHAGGAELVLVAARSDVQARNVSVLRCDAREPVSRAPEF